MFRIPRVDWSRMVEELAARGEGRRESGAFLLGPRRGQRPKVTRIVYFDDLEPGSLNGAVHLTTSAYTALWAVCREYNVEVLADVHTHPGAHIRQSHIDKENPLVAQRGHLAIIIPHYAQRPSRLRDVGTYEYGGESGWETRPRGLTHRRWW